MSSERQSAAPLPDALRAALLLGFGLGTAGLIRLLDTGAVPRGDLLLVAASSAAVLTSLVWFLALAMRRSAIWTLAMLVPYVNLIAVSMFARRYWHEGARAPALLVIAGSIGQTIGSLRLFLPHLPPLV